MNMIRTVLSRREFQHRPPVLVDIGSSSGVHVGWRELAPFSICLAFDPDDREMTAVQRQSSEYRHLHVFPFAVSDQQVANADLYLTKSPACSSLLRPRPDKLTDYEFSDRFTIVGQRSVPMRDLKSILASVNLDRVDWFKSDSQGTDLRLFSSLDPKLAQRIMVAELEPGIIDAYDGEDKLWQVLAYMEKSGFWLSRMQIKGSQRFNRSEIEGLTQMERRYFVHFLKSAPGWAEVTYLNSFLSAEMDLRDHLLGWVCAMASAEYGFAAQLATRAQRRFEDAIFQDLRKHALSKIRNACTSIPAWFPVLVRAVRKWRRMHANRSLA